MRSTRHAMWRSSAPGRSGSSRCSNAACSTCAAMSSTRSTAPGGQCAALYPEKPIYDIPGYPRIDAAELIERLAEQAAPFAPVYHLGQPVDRARRATAAGFVVDDRRRGAGRGARGDHRRRRRRVRPEPAAARRHRGVRGQERLLSGAAARGVPRPARRHRRRRRFGGRLGACRWPRSPRGSWSCTAAPSSAPRRNRPRGCEQLAEAGRIELVIPYQLHALEGADGQLAAVIVADLAGNDAPARGRLPAAVLRPRDRSRAARAMGARRSTTTASRSIPRPARPRAPGIFAIGDIADLSRQAEADPLGLRRGGAGGARDPPAGPSRRGAAFRIFDDEGRAGRLMAERGGSARRLSRCGSRCARRQPRRWPAGGSVIGGAAMPGRRIRSSTVPPCSSIGS